MQKRKVFEHSLQLSSEESLLSAVGILYGRVLIDIIRTQTDGLLCEEQYGFRSRRKRRNASAYDQLTVVSQSCEKFLAKGKDLFLAFMDIEKA